MLFSKVRRGELDREVTFIKKDISNGASNADNIDEWVRVTTDADVMARKRDLGGNDIVQDGQIFYAQRTVWTVDHREDLSTDNRLVHKGKVYSILSITDNESGRDRYLDIMTSLMNSETWT